MRADARRNRERLLAAATAAFAEHGADAPLDDIARRAGVGIGTLYRHFPTRLALQEAVYLSQVDAVCSRGRELGIDPSPGEALAAWLRDLSGYLATKRGLSRALMDTLGRDSELLSSCSQVMRATAATLLERAQQAGAVRADISALDLMRLVHGVAAATEQAPGDTGRLLSLMIDGLRVPAGAQPAHPGATAPATTGPATTGPATTGPATTGPATTGPATTGPATTGPATTGPATTGPATTGPAGD